MKLKPLTELFLIFCISILLYFLWIAADFGFYDKKYLLSEKVLENAIPLDGTISVELLNKFKPANE